MYIITSKVKIETTLEVYYEILLWIPISCRYYRQDWSDQIFLVISINSLEEDERANILCHVLCYGMILHSYKNRSLGASMS